MKNKKLNKKIKKVSKLLLQITNEQLKRFLKEQGQEQERTI